MDKNIKEMNIKEIVDEMEKLADEMKNLPYRNWWTGEVIDKKILNKNLK